MQRAKVLEEIHRNQPNVMCDADPVCVPIELLSTSTQCDVGPVCVLIELLSTSTQCDVGPHRAIVNLNPV